MEAKSKTRRVRRPNWCHRNASEMQLASSDNHQITILGKDAALTISKAPASTGSDWVVTWKITWSTAGEYFSGRICMSSRNLRTAFGLSDDCEEANLPFAKKYGADTAFPGGFIRLGTFLNIPNPRVCDTDGSISIKLTADITRAVVILLGE